MEAINKNEANEVRYIADLDTFIKMKAEQKAIISEGKTGAIRGEISRKLSDWRSSAPKQVDPYKRVQCDLGHYHSVRNPEYAKYEADVKAWRAKRPDDTCRFTKEYARLFNIVYGMARGNEYRAMERVVREGNEPSLSRLLKVIDSYGLDRAFFQGAIENAR